MRAYLEIFNLTVRFGNNVVLKELDLLIDRGEFVSIIGHSGCGKSTLLGVVAGLVRPAEGSVSLDGKEITEPGPDRAVVFQNYSLLPWLSLYENVMVAVRSLFSGESLKEMTVRAQELLRLAGLWEHRHKLPSQVSGGMKQRTALVRALAVDPKVLLLDEPFGALDALTRATLQDELLRIWERDKKTVLMVTHDVEEAIYMSDRIVVMSNGPSARVYEILSVDIRRPRLREELIKTREYTQLKEHLLYTLRERLRKKEVA
ncbi:MAG: ABC transporter ATP-binding protein [Aquificaceae bacterium]|jgi:nitrate ABC transporter ATP-binding subunit|uniref:ABC transporter ATP-binding protein n=1 Tax=Hydrogenobacter sp. Uz 6-8 TaxID=3384828 RepID=UPI000F26EADF|nr:MAG: ABC transporter ATP-binding protein [Aquificota bacterium]